MSEEGLKKTANKKIFVSEIEHIEEKEVEDKLDMLKNLIENEATPLKEIKSVMKKAVPTYRSNSEVNKEKLQKDKKKKDTQKGNMEVKNGAI